MLEKLSERIEKEIEKILSKDDLTFEEVQFLYTEKTRLENIKAMEEQKENSKKYQDALKSIMETTF